MYFENYCRVASEVFVHCYDKKRGEISTTYFDEELY